jgi:hypothetical protein
MSFAGPAAVRGLFKKWFGLDLRSLAAFRIGLALLLLTDLVGRAGDLSAHYTDQGVLPISAVTAPRYLSLHLLDGTADFQAALFVFASLCAVALLVGWWTRAATAASWFLLMSLHARNPMVLQGGDTLLRLLLFWGLFLPLGARWSLDALRERRGRPPAEERVVSAGSAALVLQVGFVYWFSAALKSDPSWRSEGTAVYYALSIDQFATPLGHYLLGFPGLLRVLTFATLGLEAVGPALLFVPWQAGRVRLAVVASFLLFHLVGLRLCLELGPFPWVCAVAWLALLPGLFWDRIADWLPRQRWLATGAAADATPALRTPLVVNVLATSLIAYVLLWNLRTTDRELWGRVLPPQTDVVATTFGIDQAWDMFAPGPLKDSGWHVAQGNRPDGTAVDLLRDGAPVCWDQPALVSATYRNERWRKYLMNLWVKDNAAHRLLYAHYLVRYWNARHEGGSALESVEVYFMLKRTLPDYHATRPRKVLLCAVGADAVEHLAAEAR